MKGSFPIDFIFIIIVILVFSLVAIFSLYIVDSFGEATSDVFRHNLSTEIMQSGEDSLESPMDSAFVFILFMFVAMMIISAFMIRTHPMFFIFSIIALAIVVVIGGQLANVFLDVSSSDALVDTGNRFPMTVWVFQNFPVILTVCGMVTIIALFFRKGD